MCEAFAKFRYSCCKVKHCTFYKRMVNYTIIVVVVVDDLTLASNLLSLLSHCKSDLQSEFGISDMGEIHWLLGVEIKCDHCARTVTLSQRAYIDAICICYHLQDARPATTPMEAGVHLADGSRNEPQANYPYKEIVGSLMYTVTATRPDIAFAMSILGQFAQAPMRIHLEAAKRVVRYLKTTHNLELMYSTDHTAMVGYSDADHASQLHRHLISGYAFLIGGGAVTWSSKKQPIVALSMTEAEYIPATHSTKEASWLHALTSKLITPPTTPIIVHCNNQSAIPLSKDR